MRETQTVITEIKLEHFPSQFAVINTVTDNTSKQKTYNNLFKTTGWFTKKLSHTLYVNICSIMVLPA